MTFTSAKLCFLKRSYLRIKWIMTYSSYPCRWSIAELSSHFHQNHLQHCSCRKKSSRLCVQYKYFQAVIIPRLQEIIFPLPQLNCCSSRRSQTTSGGKRACLQRFLLLHYFGTKGPGMSLWLKRDFIQRTESLFPSFSISTQISLSSVCKLYLASVTV